MKEKMRRTIVGMYLMASADAYMLGVGSAVQPCRDRGVCSTRGMAHAPARLRSTGDKTQVYSQRASPSTAPFSASRSHTCMNACSAPNTQLRLNRSNLAFDCEAFFLQLKMGIFDLFKNALANEDLPPPPPDGLSSDPWLSV